MSEKLREQMEATRRQMLKDRLAKLPPEYQLAESPQTMCLAEDPDGFQCTCQKGHGGEDHLALGMLGQICARWPKAAR